jgi:hypothetical protein
MFSSELLLLVVEVLEVLAFSLGLLELLDGELELGFEVGVLGDEGVVLFFKREELVGPVD